MTSTTAPTIPTFDLADLPMTEDRGAGWKALRDLGRVAVSDGAYYLSHREDVEYALRNPQIFSSAEAFDTLGSPIPLLPIAFDAPEHDQYRKLLNPFFNPKVIAEVLPSLQSQIDDLIKVIADKPAGAVTEVMSELAIPYPSQVFLTFFGLPLEDRNQLIAWKDAVISLGNPAVKAGPEALEPAFELINYLHEKIEDKRQNPANDVLSELVTGPDALDQSEAMGLCFLFVLAGLDTVTATIGFALKHLANHPDDRQFLIDNPGSMIRFIEEVVRLEPPAPMLPRVLTEDIEIDGMPIPKGSNVFVCVAAANRDPSDGDETLGELKLDGPVRRSLGFGGGPHRCLGMHLARVELRLVMDAWHASFSDYRIEEGSAPTIPWPAPVFGFETLRITTVPH